MTAATPPPSPEMNARLPTWPLFALCGLLVAAAVAFLATQSVSQKIGITSEPVSAGRALSPPARRVRRAPAAPPATTGPSTSPSPGPPASGDTGGAIPSPGASGGEAGGGREAGDD